MKPIRLPEPPSGFMTMPEIFDSGVNAVRRALVIGNSFAGAENQSIGLVRALGLGDKHLVYRVIRPRGGINDWLRWLPVYLHKIVYNLMIQIFGNSRYGRLVHGRKSVSSYAQNGWSVGLSSILEADTRQITSIARENFENGQQEIPRFLQRWITPQEPPSKNVVQTVGALHQADSAALRIAATTWHAELAPLPKPLLVVNVGGPTRNCKYGADLAQELASSLHNVLPSCGSVRISFSRRTPQKVSDIILKGLGNHPKVYIWDGEGQNPHMGHLAWADAFVITADSVSMLSEMCSTGKPVYVIGADRCKWKFSASQKTLRERGLVRPFTGLEDISNSWSYPPLNDAAEVVTRVRDALAQRGWMLR